MLRSSSSRRFNTNVGKYNHLFSTLNRKSSQKELNKTLNSSRKWYMYLNIDHPTFNHHRDMLYFITADIKMFQSQNWSFLAIPEFYPEQVLLSLVVHVWVCHPLVSAAYEITQWNHISGIGTRALEDQLLPCLEFIVRQDGLTLPHRIRWSNLEHLRQLCLITLHQLIIIYTIQPSHMRHQIPQKER